jgi:hypothetical protein
MRKAFLAVLLLCAATVGAQDFIRYYPPRTAGLSSSGTAITSTVPIQLPDGSVAAPALVWASDTQLGLYKNGQGFNLASGGTQYSIWSLTSLQFFNNVSPSVAFNADTFITRGGAAATVQFGQNAATATAQTFKGPDSTGANVTGANLTIRAGAGTSGNAVGGQLILGGGANAGSGERGAVQIEDGGTRPTCAAGIRGSIWYDAGGAGVLDTLEVCRKDASNNYAWVGLF